MEDIHSYILQFVQQKPLARLVCARWRNILDTNKSRAYWRFLTIGAFPCKLLTRLSVVSLRWLHSMFCFTADEMHEANATSLSRAPLPVLQWLAITFDTTITHESVCGGTYTIPAFEVNIVHAIKNRRMDEIRWYAEIYPKQWAKLDAPSLFRYACEYGLAEWLVTEIMRNLVPSQELINQGFSRACFHNEVETAKWIVRYYDLDLLSVIDAVGLGTLFHETCVDGHLLAAQWLYETYKPAIPDIGQLIDVLLIHGKYDVYCWVMDCIVGADAAALLPDLRYIVGWNRLERTKHVVELHNITEWEDIAPLQAACLSATPETAQWLLETFYVKTPPGEIKRILVGSFVELCRTGRILTAKWIAAQIDLETSTIQAGFRAAVLNGHLMVMKWLFAAYTHHLTALNTPTRRETSKGQDPHHSSAAGSFRHVLDASKGQDPHCEGYVDELLKSVCNGKDIRIVRWLVRAFNITNIPTLYRSTMFWNLCKLKSTRRVQLAYDMFDIPKYIIDDINRFHRALDTGNIRMLYWFVETFQITTEEIREWTSGAQYSPNSAVGLWIARMT